jgi:K+-transporting ATPase A subunit
LGKFFLSYVIAIIAGAPAFLLCLNIRGFALLIYRMIMLSRGETAWGTSLVNALAMIILMVGLVIYFFYTQNYFEKKCETKHQYMRALLILVLPVFVLFTVSEVISRFLLA